MATFNPRINTDGLTVPSFTNQPRLIQAIVDFSDTTSFPTGLAAADVVRALKIPQNSIITSAGVEVLTAGSGTGTIALADTLGSPNVFVAAATTNATGQMTRASITNNLSIYPAGTQHYLTLTGATATRTNGKVRVWALVTSLNTRDTTADKFV